MSAPRRGWSVVSSLWSFFGKRIRSSSKKSSGRRYRLTVESLENRTLLSADPFLVGDVNPGLTRSNPSWFAQVGPTLFFTADDGVHGPELWKTDGTATGTILVKDINPTGGGFYNYGPAWLTNVNGTLYFAADDGVNGRELWMSDGSEAGTVLVANIRPGSGYSYYGYGPFSSDPRGLTNFNGTLIFAANDGVHGQELWKSDGTFTGTELVKDINTGAIYDGNADPYSFTNVGGTLFFTAFDSDHGQELWTTDGTAGGTELVKDIFPGTYSFGPLPHQSYPRDLTNVSGTLFFSARNDGYGRELWKSNGTAGGTELVKDIFPGTYGSSTPSPTFTNFNGTLFFAATDDVNGPALWKSDGTATGTELVKDANPSGTGGFYEYGPQWLAVTNGTLFFSAFDDEHGSELWMSDGSEAGTVFIRDIRPGGSYTYSGYQPLGSVPHFFANVNGTVVFAAHDGEHGPELWKTDGTEAGTVLIKDINRAGHTGIYDGPNWLTVFNGSLFFSAEDLSHSRELWTSDGTEDGTALLKDINTVVPAVSSYPQNLTDVNGTLFFTANNPLTGWELWKSDGTGAGAILVKDIRPGFGYSYYGNYFYSPLGSYPGNLTNINGTLFFTANDGEHGYELWKSDGTEAGTVLVKDISPGSSSYYYSTFPLSSNPRELTNVNGTLFFSAMDEDHGRELWMSDGTEDGTVLVEDIRPGSSSSIAGYYGSGGFLTDVNGKLFFVADDGSSGQELWMSDGTEAGTVLVKNIKPGGYYYFGSYHGFSSSPTNLTNVGGTLFFTARDDEFGRELWMSNGTETMLVKDIRPGAIYYLGGYYPYSSNPRELTNVNGTLFFMADDGSTGPELWRSDGTATGTVVVKDVPAAAGYYGGLYPRRLTNVNGTLFFDADDGSTGRELWMSDGTDTGTVLVKDIRSGSLSSRPRDLINVNGTLFFSAFDDEHGRELWMSDGTEAGTVLVEDLWPGSSGGYYGTFPNSGLYYPNLANVNGTLFFSANDGSHGSELWALAPAPAAPVITGFADDSGAVGDFLTNDNTVTLSGTAAAGLIIEIFNGDTSLGITVAGDDGTWSFTTPPLADGAHSFTATATGASHNTSDPSAALAVTIDTSPPAVSVPDLDPASDTGQSDMDNVTDDKTPTFNGTGEVGAGIELREGDTILGTTTVGEDGTWSVTITTPLADGVHHIYARAMDAAGNVNDSASLEVSIVSTINVDIAIKPDGGPVNLASNGVLKVVIRSTATFNAADVNVSSVLLAGASATMSKLQDVDGDGDNDLVLDFRIQDLDLLTLYAQLLAEADQTLNGMLDANVDTHQLATLSLTGQTLAGQEIEGSGQLEVFLAGKALRDFLQEELAGQI